MNKYVFVTHPQLRSLGGSYKKLLVREWVLDKEKRNEETVLPYEIKKKDDPPPMRSAQEEIEELEDEINGLANDDFYWVH